MFPKPCGPDRQVAAHAGIAVGGQQRILGLVFRNGNAPEPGHSHDFPAGGPAPGGSIVVLAVGKI